jgi:hypothetical protein
MSNPTTPFSWQMPTATDLVTDLPADFEVFGQAVATSMADLLGGTSGQILAKNSNTDMDFVWIANDQGDITAVTAGTGISGGGTSGAVTITNSMATEIAAKGDLIVGTGSATFDNLGVGTNGQVLTADSTVSPTGLKWATASAGAVLQVKNAIKTNYQQISATSNTDITDMSIAITPSSASNKVLVLVSVNGVSAGGGSNRARIILTDGSGTQLAVLNDYAVLGTPQSSYSICYLDSPGSTAAKTFKIMGNTVDAASSFYVNNYQSVTVRSTITVMEVTP